MRSNKIYQVAAFAAILFTALSPLTATAAPDGSDQINRSAEPGVVLEAKASSGQQDAFLAAAGPAAVSVKSEFDIPASVTAGQAALESGYGTSGLSTNDKNYFGFKCASAGDPGPIATGCHPYQTTECTPSCHTVTAYFRVYRSMTDSFRDYGRLLTTSSRYTPALAYRHDPDEFIRRVAAAGYATDPNYPGKVITIMRDHNLYQLDSMTAPDADPSGAALHEVRGTDGSWTGFAPMGTDARDVSLATFPDGSAQVAIIGADDVVYHRARLADGTWTDFAPLNGVGTDTPAKGKKVSIAGGVDGSAQVVIIGWDNVAYHRVRHADGSWTEFGSLGAATKDVAVSVQPNGSAQVVIVGSDDVVYHRVRYADGSWTPFAPLNGVGTDTPAKGRKVAVAAALNGAAQVVIIGWDNGVYHRQRNADGSWTDFAPLGATAKDVAISAMTPDGSSQTLIAGTDDVVYHRVRYLDGSWTPFAPLAGFDAPAKAKKVSISGQLDGSAQVAIIGF
jgi:flagellum-specific peptidoglycan hydrolase FlgJ